MRALYIASLWMMSLCFTGQILYSEVPQKEFSRLKGHFVNQENNYEFNYPTQWQKKKAPPLDIILYAPIKPGALHAEATMNLISEKIGSGINVDQIYSQSVKNLNSELKDLRIEESGETMIGGAVSKWIRYSHQLQNIRYTVLQYFIFRDETLYLMTFSSPSDNFSHYRADFQSIASSFRFLSKNVEKK